ncbi:MAG TPA: flagellar biosynthesis repressor FlbT [Pseudolabrys sp.]|jgi:flagellar protein FlbT|nr:flagellar biosynthesis repressor FlbT [Pseudolabrys sp.]
MTLRIELKPHERILIGDCVITNSDQRARFVIEGRTPVLREKDIMTAEAADTPAKRIYLSVQLMYTSRDPGAHNEIYFALLGDFLRAAPSARALIESINNQILTGNLYNALKDARKLITFEQDLLSNEKRRTALRKRGKANLESAQP